MSKFHLIEKNYRNIAYDILERELTYDEEADLRLYTLNLTDTLDKHNSITISDDVIRTHGNVEVLTKQTVISLIEKLQHLLPEYDKNIKVLEDISITEFIEQVTLIKKKSEMPPKEGKKTRPGYVYVMKDMAYYKIGRCDLTKSRLGEYTKLPEEPIYLLMEKVNDTIKIEHEIHNMFSDKRLRNGTCEWFSLSDDDIEQIRIYLNENKDKEEP